jgi:hypothetical protein
MLKRTDGRDEWKVAAFGGDSPVQLKYCEDMTDNLIKYVLLDVQPKESFKEFDVYSLLIFKGVLRIVPGGRRRYRFNRYYSFLFETSTRYEG